MLKPRFIPILLLDKERLVKTTKFRKPVYVGDPINAIKIFNEKEVDEIVVLDISASKEGRKPNFKLIEDFASECFMPLTYGGGIRTMEDANTLFSLGVEKISIKSMMIENRNLVQDLVNRFGSQAIVFSLDVQRSRLGRIALSKSNLKSSNSLSWEQLLDTALDAGIGEVLICDVGREGTLTGIDEKLIKEISSVIPTPVIYTGGVRQISDFGDALHAGADAVGAGAFFVFSGPNRAVLITYPKPPVIDQEIKRIFNFE